MSPILVTLTSHSDSDVESSNVSLKENKPDGVNPNSNDIDYYVRKNEGKILWFSADVFIENYIAFNENTTIVLHLQGNNNHLQWFSVLSTVFEQDRVVFNTQKSLRARDAVQCSDVFLTAGNNPGVL